MFKKDKIFILVGAIALFFAYAWFPLATDDLWNSPDESAVAFFATRMPVFGGAYDVPATFPSELGGIVHPRSMNVVGGQLVPGMWLGVPWLFSLMHALTGLGVDKLDVVVPIFAVLAVLAWQQVVFKITGGVRVAWFSAIALAVHPGWWYFTARGLHPNVLFLSMLIFATYFWYVLYSRYKKSASDVLAEASLFMGGLCVGMAVFIRTNELVWILPILGILIYVSRKLSFRELSSAFIGVLIPVVIMLHLNASIFGSALYYGYNSSVDPAVAQVSTHLEISSPVSSSLLQYIFPFGLHEMNILRNVWNFHFSFFALWTFFALYGLLLLIFRHKSFSKQEKDRFAVVGILAGLVSLYLLALYGSWNISDNPDPTAITIGTSYIRYWLPVTLFMTPLIGYAIATGFASNRTRSRKTILMIIWVSALVLSGIQMTYVGKDDGLLYVDSNIERYHQERSLLLEHTTSTDILIVDRSDKIIFPHRQVVLLLRDETTYASIPLMVEVLEKNESSLYYYGVTLPATDLDFLRSTRLEPSSLKIDAVTSFGIMTLYKISIE